MACRNREDVMFLLNRQKQQIFEECQRGAFNTSCTQDEREALKLINTAIDNATNMIIRCGQHVEDKTMHLYEAK